MRPGFKWFIGLLLLSILVLLVGPVILQVLGLATGGHP